MKTKPLFAALTLAGSLLAASPAHAELSLTFGGDVNFNASRVAPRADGALKGRLYPFATLLSGIKPYLDGDLNFANIETVVTEKNLPPTNGRFVFATHPNAIRACMKAGFNFFNLSNNHAGDHGQRGLVETLDSFEDLSREGEIYYGGVGRDRNDVLNPRVFDVRTRTGTYRIAFLALTGPSNVPTQAGPGRPGTLSLRDPNDVSDALRAIRSVRADYKILSVHNGTEGKMTLDAGQRALYQRMLKEGDVDLILGHHPHRVRPVEKVGHKVIFYSLGNYLMLGAANINPLPDLGDYGLIGKLHLEWDPSLKRLVAQAAEAIPIYDMHILPKALSPAESANRLKALNTLGDGQLGTNNIRFTNDRGTGVACLGDNPGPRGASVCQRAGQ